MYFNEILNVRSKVITKDQPDPAHVQSAGNELERAIGSQVRRYRSQMELTVTELANRAELSPGMLSKIENGNISPSLATLRALSTALHVPVTALFRQFEEQRDATFVPAGYLMWQMQQGASLKQALEQAILDLDGFYTFAVGTRDGFAVLRDPIACKPAVMAETDDWVAMASEFRAIAQLPGVDEASIWEPAPATVYSWGDS